MTKHKMFNHQDEPFHHAGAISNAADRGNPRRQSLGSRAIKEFTSYDGEFFVGQKDLSYQSARQVIPIVQQFVPVGSVCDVGCGVGTWLRAFDEAGVQDILGIDGHYVDKNLLEIPSSVFHEADLRQPLRLDRSFDLAMSIEVAEHLPENRSISFVEDLTRLAPVVLFSAAIPRQGGTAHINEQWQSYWAALFARCGFATCDVLRPIIWDNADIARWYRQNILLFCRRDFLPEVPRLKSGPDNTLPLSVVHPQQYLEIWEELNVRRSWQLLTDSLQRALHRREERLRRALRSALGMRGGRGHNAIRKG
jgi:2-polyprenyl-3-methyl-5-hydroxy-6-metoxy-1,4-benzoquinol methylase